MEESEVNQIVEKHLDKDPRWQLVLGWKGKKWRVKGAIDKLERVIRENEKDIENPVQNKNKNAFILEEVIRLRDCFDFYNKKMKEVINEIHEDSHK